MIRLIADAGSTKTDWALIPGSLPVRKFATSGVNPVVMPKEEIVSRFQTELCPKLDGEMPDEVYYYGAGCIPSVCADMQQLLSEITGCAKVTVASDMLGAARSLCGHRPGIACILGTGSNSCLYDGEAIVDAVAPLGFILGDEGSGAVIGRRFLSDMIKRQYPPEIDETFEQRFGLSAGDIVRRVYKEASANVFLASFMPFVRECLREERVEAMVVDEFCRFLRRNVAAYAGSDTLPVSFTGSVACHFSSQLRSALAICGMKAGEIKADPINGLINYHNILTK